MAGQLSQIDSALASLARDRPDLWSLSACGLTPAQEPIPSLLHRDARPVIRPRISVLHPATIPLGLSGCVGCCSLKAQLWQAERGKSIPRLGAAVQS